MPADIPSRRDVLGPRAAGRRRVAVPSTLAAAIAGSVPEDRLVVWRSRPADAPGIESATGAVLWHRDPALVCRDLLALCPRLDWVHSLWTGVGHLPLEALLRRRITVTTGRGVPAGPLAEWVLAALLWHAKRLDAVATSWRRGEWAEREIAELDGARVVVLGVGSIGRAVAKRLAAMGVTVTGVATRRRRVRGFRTVVGVEDLEAACRGAAGLVVAAPLTAATAGMVGRDVLGGLADGALVVNVGRAAVVDEPALAAEVDRGRLGAALDVWWEEPVAVDSPWRRRAGVLASPHAAYRTSGYRRHHAERAQQNVSRYLTGRRLLARASRGRLRAMAAADREAE